MDVQHNSSSFLSRCQANYYWKVISWISFPGPHLKQVFLLLLTAHTTIVISYSTLNKAKIFNQSLALGAHLSICMLYLKLLFIKQEAQTLAKSPF